MKRVWCVAFLYLVVGCNSFKSIKGAFVANPYDKYVASLEKAGLDKTSMGMEWLQAGRKVFEDSIIVQLPCVESGYFQANEPEARSYRFDARDGQVLTVQTVVRAKPQVKLFVDLFLYRDGKWSPVAHADSNLVLTYEFDANETCLLRVQPELLVHAFYTISISRTPVLINPVKGAGDLSIGSMYGAPRDGGARSHEGVDIFAAKGTPVIAPTDGRIAKTGTSRLGGKVVWMYDSKRGHSYYFAHLDTQTVQVGQEVKQGDVLGKVGNTGNAHATPPHLHFGIYQRGSKDPINYIRSLDKVLTISKVDTAFEPQMYKVVAKTSALRMGPSKESQVKKKLEVNNGLRIIGQSQDWYRVALPNKTQGYVAKQHVAPLGKGESMEVLDESKLLSEAQENAAPIAYVKRFSFVKVLASFENYRYVRTKEGMTGWLQL